MLQPILNRKTRNTTRKLHYKQTNQQSSTNDQNLEENVVTKTNLN